MTHDDYNSDFDHLPGNIEDPRGRPVWMLTFISTALFIVTVLAVAAMYYGAVYRETQGKLVSVRTQAAEVMREARAMQNEDEPHWETWTDADGELAGEKTLKIPVDDAARIIIERYGSENK